MIVEMMKYSFVLHHLEYEDFLASLRELGLVDINIMGWEPNDGERALLADIEFLNHSVSHLGGLLQNEKRTKSEKFASAEETFLNFKTAETEIVRLDAAIAKVTKEIDELEPWGEFDITKVKTLADKGVTLNFFTCLHKEFVVEVSEWREKYAVEEIFEKGGLVYFIVITTPESEPLAINANEIKQPTATAAEKRDELKGLEFKRDEQLAILERCAEGMDDLRSYGNRMRENLHLSQVTNTATREVEGKLVIIEGWATAETVSKVDALIEERPALVAYKDKPKEEEDTPVLLRNNKFARLFEIIGDFYSLPKYGTLDLTPFFAPFYMIFFGFCLADAGYGLLYVVGSLIAYAKVPEKFRPYTMLAMLCGISTMFFGLLTGNAFGIELAKQPFLAPLHNYIISSNDLFMLAIILGIIHILFGMLLKVIFRVRSMGFAYALSTIGWMITIISGLCAVALPKFGIDTYTMSSVPFMIITGIGIFMMLFLNSPGRNPFFNFGLGLWNTYNDVTGLLSDVLSYIRLFALGLSGGILALVFNRLAVGMSPDIIIVKQIMMLLILGVGQGLTLFMASLSAFVHPLRLTFVEFYKNAGFEAGGRRFNPLRRINDGE